MSNPARRADSLGTLSFMLPENDPNWSSEAGAKDITIKRIPGAQFAGIADKDAVRNTLLSLRKKGMSPIQINTFDILPGEGIYVAGQIKPDISILKGTSIDFEFTGGDITLSKEFGLGEFNVPDRKSTRL